MSTEALIFVGGLILFILFVRLLHIKRKTDDLKEETERAMREVYEPEEEFYDSETGKSYTLEEVSKEGFTFGISEKKYIPSQEEIEFLYSGDVETIKLLERHLKTLRFAEYTFSDEYEQALGELCIFEGAHFWHITTAVEINEKFRILIVEFEPIENPNYTTYRQTLLLLHKSIRELSGHHFIVQTTVALNVASTFFESNDQMHFDGYQTQTLEPSEDVSLVRNILLPYLQLPKVALEIDGTELYIITNRTACIEDFELLLQVGSDNL
jgi:hypothetical protein